MKSSFLNSFQSEWIKKRRTASSWLVIIGAFFIPFIVMISLFVYPATLHRAHEANEFWKFIYNRNWPSMAMLLLPLGVILTSSLITQLEFKNNTWKLIHTTPQKISTIFFAKFSIILVMMLQFFVLFNIGMFLSGFIPSLVLGVSSPNETFPFLAYLKGSGTFFVDCLPIIALQYLIGLQFKNFLVPVGVGLALYVGSLIALNWKYGYTIPYIYCALNFSGNRIEGDHSNFFHYWSVAYFIFFMILSYILYIKKKERG